MKDIILVFFDEEKSRAEDVEGCCRHIHGYTEGAINQRFSDNLKKCVESHFEGTKPKLKLYAIPIVVCECTNKLGGSRKKKGSLSESLFENLKKTLKHLDKNVSIHWVRLLVPFVNIEEMKRKLEDLVEANEEVRLTVFTSRKDRNGILLAGPIIKKCEHIHLVTY